MTPDSVLKQADGLFVEEIDGENLLYRVGLHKAIHLNGTATAIFKLCDGSRSVQEIAALLKSEYPDSEAKVEADVLEAARLLVREGVLELIRTV
jgi:hypothetical protein